MQKIFLIWCFCSHLNRYFSVATTFTPTHEPTTFQPTIEPTSTTSPTYEPTTIAPTFEPTITFDPTISSLTIHPSTITSNTPSYTPTIKLTFKPSLAPSMIPTYTPSLVLSMIPTNTPTLVPTSLPTIYPSNKPSDIPSITPTIESTVNPSFMPTKFPTYTPTLVPTSLPTIYPSNKPSDIPSITPTIESTANPSFMPTKFPTYKPSVIPTIKPSIYPTIPPTYSPSNQGNSFNAAQALINVTANSIDTNNGRLSFVNSVSLSTNGSVAPYQVEILNILSTSRRRLSIAWKTEAIPKVRVEYRIFFGFSDNPSSTYQYLANSINESVNSGTFTQYLRQSAFILNASGIDDVAALPGSVTFSTIEYNTAPSMAPSVSSLTPTSSLYTTTPTVSIPSTIASKSPIKNAYPSKRPFKSPTKKPIKRPTSKPIKTKKPTKYPSKKPTNKPIKLSPTKKPKNKPVKKQSYPTNKPKQKSNDHDDSTLHHDASNTKPSSQSISGVSPGILAVIILILFMIFAICVFNKLRGVCQKTSVEILPIDVVICHETRTPELYIN